MVKAKAGVAKLRQKAERRAKDEAAKQRETDGREPLIQQRLQKKVTKRVQFLESVASSKRQASLAVQGGLKKKRRKGRKQVADKRLGDLSQLAASLQEAAQLDESKAALLRPKGLGVGGAKKRLRIVEQESKRLQQVLSHPQFQADPFAAIAHHLNAKLPPAPEPQKPKADPQARKQQKARRKFEKRLQKSSQGMDEDSE